MRFDGPFYDPEVKVQQEIELERHHKRKWARLRESYKLRGSARVDTITRKPQVQVPPMPWYIKWIGGSNA